MSPLSHERLAILLALAKETQTASTIAGTVLADSVGSVYIKYSSLYYLLADLMGGDYIVSKRDAYSEVTYYDLTPKGWRILEHELPRLQAMVQLLQVRLSPRQYRDAPSRS
jgi:DNA-binding PadR family transcriptional regulator